MKKEADDGAALDGLVPSTPREKALRDARALTTGPRALAYGEPRNNLRTMRDILVACLGADRTLGSLDASDMALVMMAAKLSRLPQSPTHEDTLVDLVAYAAIFAELRGYGNGAR